jgi:hypothetical protein
MDQEAAELNGSAALFLRRHFAKLLFGLVVL